MLIIVTITTGLIASQVMVRELFPETSTNNVMVTMAFPGADPEEVEEGISRKIEEAIDGLEGVKRYRTISYQTQAQAIVEIQEGEDVEKIQGEIENAIDGISTFPRDAEQPIVTELKLNPEVMLIALSGDMDERTRKELAAQIKDELQAIRGISQVSISGTRDYEITIELSEERMREYGLTFASVAQAIRQGNMNLSGGSIRTKGEQISLRAVGRKYTGEEFAPIVVLSRPDGEIITLDRIATIRDGFTEDPVIARFNGRDASLITVNKTSREDTIRIAGLVEDYVARKQAELPEGIHLNTWGEGATIINGRLSVTFVNGLAGLLVVLIVLWLFLDTRLAFWVAMGIPISMCGALTIMWLWGTTISSITLFGLVMVLGIIVDDAIVVGEAIYLHRRNGDGPLEAAVNALMEVGMPVIAAVITTIIAILPLSFVDGMMGRVVGVMPVACCGALAVSLVEALFLLPAHLSHLPDPNREEKRGTLKYYMVRARREFNEAFDAFINNVYYRVVRGLVHYRYVGLSAGVAVLIITGGLGRGGYISFLPFPQYDENGIQAVIEFPEGTPASVTQSALEGLQAVLHELTEELRDEGHPLIVKNVYSVVGEAGNADRGLANIGSGGGGSHRGYVRIELFDSEVRGIHSEIIMNRWQELTPQFPGALSQSFSIIGSSPSAPDIELWLKGDTTESIEAASRDLQAKLRSYDGVHQVEDDLRKGKREMRIDLKPEARTHQLTLDDLARQVYAGFYGEEALRLQRGRDDVRVKVRYEEAERQDLDALKHVRVRTPTGKELPFFSVADVEYTQSLSRINRENGAHLATITAEVVESQANAQNLMADILNNYAEELEDAHPGVELSAGTSQQDTLDSLRSMALLFPLAMAVVFVILATLFRSYLQPFIIMLTVPFGILGAIFGHVALGMTLVMFSVFGMMALTGVVVNDGIVLIEAVNTQIARGLPIFDAIAKGAARRFRAITLTTISTIAALFPLIIETNLAAQPLKPMALSVASGVAFATLITMFLTPCLLGILNDVRRVLYLAVWGRWPSREEVEPARERGKTRKLADESPASPTLEEVTTSRVS